MSQVKALDEPSGTIASFEELLVHEGAVTDKQLARARRIASRLDKPQPLGAVLIELGQLPRAGTLMAKNTLFGSSTSHHRSVSCNPASRWAAAWDSNTFLHVA